MEIYHIIKDEQLESRDSVINGETIAHLSRSQLEEHYFKNIVCENYTNEHVSLPLSPSLVQLLVQ
jgi:hypothetical protein